MEIIVFFQWCAAGGHIHSEGTLWNPIVLTIVCQLFDVYKTVVIVILVGKHTTVIVGNAAITDDLVQQVRICINIVCFKIIGVDQAFFDHNAWFQLVELSVIVAFVDIII